MDEKDIYLGAEPKPLVDWKNPPSLRELKQDLTDASSYHSSHVAKIDRWLDNFRVEGGAKVNAGKGRSSVVPKLIRKHAEWRYPALSEPFLSTDELFKVSPVSWEDRNAAFQNQLVLNNQFNTQLDKVGFIDEFIRTVVDEGTAIVKVGWKYEEEEVEKEIPTVAFVVDPDFLPQLQQIAELRDTSPSEFDTNVPDEMKQALQLSEESGQPVAPQVTGYQVVKEMQTVANHPTLEVCDYRNVIVDPTCAGDISKAGFIIHRFESSLSQLKKDGRYKNLDDIKTTNSSVLSDPDYATGEESRSFNFSDEPRKKLVVYEYWGFWDIHKTGKVVPFVASWVDGVLIRMEENPFPDKALPFVITSYLPVRKSLYGEPDGELLEDNQKIIGAVTRGMIDILGKSANAQTGVAKNMLDATNRRKFLNGDDYEYNPQVDPRMGVYMHTFNEIPQSAGLVLQMQQMEAESLTGVKSFGEGIGSASLGDVAAGIRGALDASSKRELAILRRISRGIIQIGRKFIGMNAAFLSDREVVRITNEQFVEIRKDDLPGNFDLKLSIATAEEDNMKAQELAFMLQTMGNNMDANISKMILVNIAKLRKMPDLAKAIENYEPQPDPIAQKLHELEAAKAEAEVMRIQAQAQLDQAKAVVEQVRAQHIKSDTDLKDLNFVEQESGVTQARNKELQGEQARAQAQLKVLDHAFKSEENNKKLQNDLIKEQIKSSKKE